MTRCKYQGNDVCTLDSIEISPCPHNRTGEINETDCASFNPE
ncbi:DUF1540 domain-containing protein [Metallumcola ferriviriculae]